MGAFQIARVGRGVCGECKHAHLSTFSGYDFGYFLKLLTAASLPTTEEAFFNLLGTWFPTVYDIKFLMRASKILKGGLQDVADDLGVGDAPHALFLF